MSATTAPTIDRLLKSATLDFLRDFGATKDSPASERVTEIIRNVIESGATCALIVKASKPLVDYLLSLNTHNRTPKPSNIKLLKREILEGNWFLTNQGIGVTKTGFLTDGQNRLMAMVEAEYPPAEFVLVTGLQDSAQAVVDRHVRRRQTDVIRLVMNRTVSNQVVAAVNVLLKMKQGPDGFFQTGSRTSEFDLAEFIAERIDLLEEIMPAVGSLRAPIAAAIIEYAERYSVEKAKEFAEQVRRGLGLTQSMPAYRLRRWLDTNKGNGQGGQTACYSVVVSAIIAHAKDEPISLLRASLSWDRLPRRQKTVPPTESAT